MSDIESWLDQNDLGKYAKIFAENDIRLDVLPDLDPEDLKDLGVSLGDRKRLLRAIQALIPKGPAHDTHEIPSPDDYPASGGAERRQLTVMFCDLVGSVELGERMDVEDYRDLLGRFRDAVVGALEQYDGFVARHQGDGLLAYFGYPQAHEDDAERAVRAGLAIVRAVRALQHPYEVEPRVRVGIATGSTVVGDVLSTGTSMRWELAALGPTPNMAARLQSEAQPNTVLISETTHALTSGHFSLEALAPRALKGIAKPVVLYRVEAEQLGQSRFAARSGGQLSRFVGRDEELGLLIRRWATARSGRGQVGLIVGEAGIGKSRLLQQLLDHLDTEPHEIMTLQCSPYHAGSALYPLISGIESTLGLSAHDDDESRLNALRSHLEQMGKTDEQMFSLLAHLLCTEVSHRFGDIQRMDAAQRREQTLRALAEYFCKRAVVHPLLCAFEDVHWADPSTREVLGRLVDRIEREPVLLLVTTRPGFEAGWTDLAHAGVLSLSRLGLEAGGQLAQSVASAPASLPSDVVEVILARAEGNPLFIEELTRAVLTSRGTLTPNHVIPSTLQDSLMARLDASDAGKAVAQYASAIGRVFEGVLLSYVWDGTQEQLFEGLEALSHSGLVSRQGQGKFTRYAFKHALVRDAAYETLLRSKRQNLHARIVEALETHYPTVAATEPELLAHHLTEAGQVVSAIQYWYRAGERAAMQSANVEAIVQLRRALQLLEELPDAPDRARRELGILVALGGPLIATAGFASPEVGSNSARARVLFRQVGAPQETAVFFRSLWQYYVVRADLNAAAEIGEEILTLAQTTNDPALLLEAHFALGGSEGFSGHLHSARLHLEKSLGAYEPERDQPRIHRIGSDAGVFVRCYLSHFLWLLGYADQARQCMGEAIQLAQSLSHPFSVAMSLAYETMLHQFCRDPQRTRESAIITTSICSEHGFAYYAAWAAIMQGWVSTQDGRAKDGIALMRRGLSDLRATGGSLREAYYVAMVAEALASTGRIDEAYSLLSDLVSEQAEKSERWALAEVYRTESNLLAYRRSGETAEKCLKAAIAIAQSQGARSFELRSAYCLAMRWRDEGKSSEARQLLEPVFTWFTEGLDTLDLIEAKALLEQLD